MSLGEELRGILSSGSVVVLGIGNELKADDGAGVVLARRLLRALNSHQRITVISSGSSPENYLRSILASRPDAIMLIDTAETGGKPGDVRLLGAESLVASTPSTHSLSPALLMEMLSLSSPAKVRLLAIQPKSLALGGALSPEVKESLVRLEKTIVEIVGSRDDKSAGRRGTEE